MTLETVSQQDVEAIIAEWPETARQSATTAVKKYGPPREASPSLLVWYDNGPWKWTVVWREETSHDFPSSHCVCWRRGSTTGYRRRR